MKKTHKFQTVSIRKVALWGLVAVLTLLLLLGNSGSAGARTQGIGSEGETTSLAFSPAPRFETGDSQSEVAITYTYDDAGRLVQADYGAGQDIAYTYDAAGNLLQREVTGASYPIYLPVIMR